MLYQLSYASEANAVRRSSRRKPPSERGGAELGVASGTSRYPFLSSFLRQQAGDGARTRDIKLGRLALYQLSYSRETFSTLCSCPGRHRRRQAPVSGGGRIRTFVGVKPADLQSAPVGRLGTPPIPAPSRSCGGHRSLALSYRADGESRTRNRLITNQVLCQLSYVSRQPIARAKHDSGPRK